MIIEESAHRRVTDALGRAIVERDRLRDALARAEAERDAALLDVGKLVDSCWYRTQAKKVAWKQGTYFGVGVADSDDERSYLEAIRSIRHNAGLPEDGGSSRDDSSGVLRDRARKAEAERDAAVARAEAAEAEAGRLAGLLDRRHVRLPVREGQPAEWTATEAESVRRLRAEVERLKAAFADRVWGDRIAMIEEEVESLRQIKAGAPRAAIGREDLAYRLANTCYTQTVPWKDFPEDQRALWLGMIDTVLAAIGGPAPSDPPDESRAITVRYTNWRGESADRRIVPLSLRWASTEWHPGEQWLVEAWDVGKQAVRSFALAGFVGAPAPAAIVGVYELGEVPILHEAHAFEAGGDARAFAGEHPSTRRFIPVRGWRWHPASSPGEGDDG